MLRVRRDLCERLQHKASFVHGGMGDGQSRIVKDQISKQQNIDVKNARSFFLRSPPPHLLLDFENGIEKLSGCRLRIQRDRAIQKPSLRSKFDGFSFVER